MDSEVIENINIGGKAYLAEPAIITDIRTDWGWGLGFKASGFVVASPSYNRNSEYGQNYLAQLLTTFEASSLDELIGRECYVLTETLYGGVRGVATHLESNGTYMFPE